MNRNSQICLHFSSISGKEVRADFTGGQMTSDAGVLLLGENEKSVCIIDGLSQAAVRTSWKFRVENQGVESITTPKMGGLKGTLKG